MFHRDLKVVCAVEGCGKFFRDTSDMKSHFDVAHERREKFRCENAGCRKRYKYEHNFKQHQLKYHNIQDKKQAYYRCEVEDCTKVFTHQHLLEGHMVYHTGTKVFKCPSCQKEFSYKHNLQRHTKKPCTQQSQNGENDPTESAAQKKMFVCEKIDCGKGFSDKRSMIRHQNAADSNLRFVCSKCKSAFSYPSGLSRHSKTCVV